MAKTLLTERSRRALHHNRKAVCVHRVGIGIRISARGVSPEGPRLMAAQGSRDQKVSRDPHRPSLVNVADCCHLGKGQQILNSVKPLSDLCTDELMTRDCNSGFAV